MTETSWLLEPRDPLVVRDGRPNSGRSESRVLGFPLPSTIAGGVRTRLGSGARGFEMQDRIEELLGVSVDVLTLQDLPAKFRDVVAQEARPV